MEIIDCASELLRSVVVTSDNKEAFANADVIILLEEQWQVSLFVIFPLGFYDVYVFHSDNNVMIIDNIGRGSFYIM